MRLAWQCGEPHADFLLARLTAEQAVEIEAFAAAEPLRESRADLRAAMQSLITARAAGAKGVKLEDFLKALEPAEPGRDREQTREDMDLQMMKVAGLFAAAERAKHGDRN